ncbi:MAG: hypothetical protein A3D13_09080 [Planctomycetes bacterium RIFCSPHIGHO2_02_FULL_40_12]|nr:MAG: hypothetical protein A3D13_09080 [Planctomycetes bacterium RIFCSPHIGHO2_02_FULL_40_12]OHC04021.1 MAG: hypothetical protein A3H23_04865 [Planctomycetes bacterium RIFCSPLOWO2_12_FULL_40_19]
MIFKKDDGIITLSFFKAKYRNKHCLPVLIEENSYEFDVNKLSGLKIDVLADFLNQGITKNIHCAP